MKEIKTMMTHACIELSKLEDSGISHVVIFGIDTEYKIIETGHEFFVVDSSNRLVMNDVTRSLRFHHRQVAVHYAVKTFLQRSTKADRVS